MKTTLRALLVVALLLGGISPAWAHHGGGGAGSLSIGQSILDRLYPPRTNLYFNFEFNSLDNGVGYTILNNVRGEYAFFRRFSIGATIPVWTVQNSFLPSNTRIGDVGILFKGEIWESKHLRMNLFGGLNTFFPTGDDQVSLGAGAVSFTPYFTYLKDWGPLDLFVNVLGSFEVSGDVNPTMSYEAGITVTMVKGKLPVSFIVSYQGVTYIVNDTFTGGSTKGYIVPGFLLEVGEHWELAFLGRISVVDTLGLQPNIPFNDFATGLFEDIAGSFVFNLGYRF